MASRRSRRRRKRKSRRLPGDIRDRGRRGGRSAADIVRASRIKRAQIDLPLPGGGVRQAGKTFFRSTLGRKALTVARQRLSRIPGLGRVFATSRSLRVKSARQLRLEGQTSLAVQRARGRALKAAVPVAIGAGAAGVAFETGRQIIDAIPGGVDLARRIGRAAPRRRTRGQAIPFTPGGIVPTDSITHTWVANGVPFAQLADGRVMVRRKNGTIKTFRRPRPIVLGRNPGVRDIVRADKKIESLLKVMRKRLSPARRPRAPARHSEAHN